MILPVFTYLCYFLFISLQHMCCFSLDLSPLSKKNKKIQNTKPHQQGPPDTVWLEKILVCIKKNIKPNFGTVNTYQCNNGLVRFGHLSVTVGLVKI